MGLEFNVHVDGLEQIAAELREAANEAEAWLASEVLNDTEPYVPALTLSLTNRSRVSGRLVIYHGPYARYLYYGKVMVGPKTGRKHATDKNLVFTKTVHPQAQAFWFEASKAQNLKKWKDGVKKFV